VRIKSYFAKTITEAMERARVELGPDAMIVASNRTSGETERLGVYEVVFGFPGRNENVEATRPPAPPAVESHQGLERLRTRMEDLRKSVSKKREQVSQAKLPFAARVSRVLMQTGFPENVAEELASGVQARDKQDVVRAVRAVLTSRVRVAPRLGMPGRTRSIVAVVGPPGVGKTTTIVKMAMRYGIAKGRPTRLISTDTFRLGGSDLIRRYADAMDLPFEAPTTLDALERSLAAGGSESLILIDTEGIGGGELERTAPLASFLAVRTDVDVHLALPAYASFEDSMSMASRFKMFLPSKAILTGVDASSNIGPALAQAIASEASISFLGTGREVPDHLEEASTGELISRLLPSLTAAAAAAA
jgi:flagellar biosynthesis protein FlhF